MIYVVRSNLLINQEFHKNIYNTNHGGENIITLTTVTKKRLRKYVKLFDI